MNKALDSLEEAKKCLEYNLYSQVIETCDRVVQQLLAVLLKFYKINLGSGTNELPTVLANLRNNRIFLRSVRDLNWLRKLRNAVRYSQKPSTQGDATHALMVGRSFVKEAKRLIGSMTSDLGHLRL